MVADDNMAKNDLHVADLYTPFFWFVLAPGATFPYREEPYKPNNFSGDALENLLSDNNLTMELFAGMRAISSFSKASELWAALWMLHHNEPMTIPLS